LTHFGGSNGFGRPDAADGADGTLVNGDAGVVVHDVVSTRSRASLISMTGLHIKIASRRNIRLAVVAAC
jgi:hypothetical protein